MELTWVLFTILLTQPKYLHTTAKSLWQSFLNTISASNISFFSFLDFNNQDDELIVVVYCAKNNLTEELSVCTGFISLCNPTRGNAAGIHECICEALKFMGIEALNVESVGCQVGLSLFVVAQMVQL